MNGCIQGTGFVDIVVEVPIGNWTRKQLQKWEEHWGNVKQILYKLQGWTSGQRQLFVSFDYLLVPLLV